jgi:hypothetical protein
VLGSNPSEGDHSGLSTNQVSAAPPEGGQDQSNSQHVGMVTLVFMISFSIGEILAMQLALGTH